MTGVRIALWIACVPLLFALGACSTSKGARSGSSADGTATRGGGYYLDDGDVYKRQVQAGPWPQREHALDAAARVRGATALQPFPIFR